LIEAPINRLSKEYINTLPIIKFAGDVVMVDQDEDIDKVVQKLQKEKYVGFDTESRPSFTKGITYPISLIQIATEEVAYLFRSNGNEFPGLLWNFLGDKNILKIGIGLNGDMEKLKQFDRFYPGNFVDLSKIASEKGIIQVGARALTARYLQKRLVKTAQRTNWAVPNLTEKQKVYAATDAWICLRIYPLIQNDNNIYPPEEKEDEHKVEDRVFSEEKL
jgi:ribonuclease D